MASNKEPDMTRILGGIHVGGVQPIIAHTPLMAAYNITHILSVMKFAVIPEYLVRKSYTLKNIAIDDDDKTDILQYFNETNRFIDECLFPNEPEYDPKLVDFRKKPQKGAIYVHCHAGVSRSVSFVVAYLMYRYGFDLKTALHAVRRKRSNAQPNDNFMEQLKIFEEMGGNKVDSSNSLYIQWRLKNSAKNGESGSELLANDDIYHKDSEKELQEIPEDDVSNMTAIRCKKCRQRLALSSSFIKHTPPTRESSEGHFIRKAAGSRRIIDIQQSQDHCSHFFVEPLSWMKEELQGKQELEGKFNCPNCSSKVGGYNWKGSRCSCGKWVIPAIHLQTSKIDEFSLERQALPNVVQFHSKQ
ncbi:HDR185Cp [Eremothecium sinecaudum]|uniref:protein-tyrosine-phosphatase n=1 Tax=Eremothecium sinecaudum TaxID=45286 RepID=A0A109UX81_9SACH|nr:HDR185Cp [Eremothecium sinecaudum]AMD20927.1 HDR185Cp [Eremothecium sinecaudum]